MNFKRMILLLFFVAIQAGQNHTAQIKADPDIITVRAVATSSNVFTLENGKEIKVYNDVLQVNETYILTLDLINDYEPIDYIDLETFELNNYEFLK